MSTTPFTPRATLVTDGPQAKLLVDGQPFRVLGGELHNSASSSPEAIRTAFSALEGLNLNTVLAPVAWFQFEPREGVYDVSLVDELLAAARRDGLRLILLWFGAWKNGRSSYMPAWVRSDARRFPRGEVASRAHREHLSPFSPAIAEADSRAFAALMRHLREVDGGQATVVMVQVENEVGLLGDSRDRSPLADQHYHSPVPAEVFAALEADAALRVRASWEERGRPTQGSWPEVFGESVHTDEAFMAAAYARHVEAVTAAGKAEYPLPMFANAWLFTQMDMPDGTPAGGQTPGVYPSGGPVPGVGGLWTAVAPSLDLLTPDIYFGDFPQICRDYLTMCGGLLIPEMRRDEAGAGNAFEAIGSFGALGVSPFGIDSTTQPESEALTDAYRLLGGVSDAIFAHESVGIHLHDDQPSSSFALGDFIVTAKRDSDGVGGEVPHGYGVVILESDTTMLISGRGLVLTFASSQGMPAELVFVDELARVGDELSPVRALNGDETDSGTLVLLPSLTEQLPSKEYRIPTVRRREGTLRVTLAHAPTSTN